MEATAALSVTTEHTAVAVGERAPASVNPTVAAHGKLPLAAVDSRAQAGTPVPDPSLHATTIKAALAAKRPLVVVVSTPAFCTSRFCGPITDFVEHIAAQSGGRTAFVHIEVWGDYEDRRLNEAAAEWVARGEAEGNEPWVFVVGSDGVVKARFDNVVSEAQLTDAIDRYAR
jgi:hypothetical protein